MKAKLIGGVMMGMLLCAGISESAKAQYGHRGGVSFSLSVGTPGAVGYVQSGPAYCPPAPAYCPAPAPAYCPPAPVYYEAAPVYYRAPRHVYYRRPHCNNGYYNGAAYGGYRRDNYYGNRGGQCNNGYQHRCR